MPRKQYTIHYIYKTTCIPTGRFYVGMHSTFDTNDGYLGSGKILWRSIQKYGEKNHKKKILEFCKDRPELRKREKEIVNELFAYLPKLMEAYRLAIKLTHIFNTHQSKKES